MMRILALAVLLVAAGCAATGPGDGDDGRCLYSVNGPRGQHIVWAPCDSPPPMMRHRLTEPGEM
jgi:hypothetical protein